MSMHITKISVEANTRLEAEKAAKLAAKKAGHTVVIIGAPESANSDDSKWDVPVTVEGEAKKIKKKLKVVKDSDEE